MEPLEQQITGLIADQVKFKAAAEAQIAATGVALTETKDALTKIHGEFKAAEEKLLASDAARVKMQMQLDAIDLAGKDHHVSGGSAVKSFGQLVTEHPKFVERIKNIMHGNEPIRMSFDTSPFEGRKTTITTVGVGTGTSGVQMPQRLFDRPLGLAMLQLRVRDLLTVRKLTTGNSFDYPIQNLRTNAPSPQVEAATKAESTYGWTSAIGLIQTIAHFTNVSRQALDDISWMREVLDSELLYGLLLKEEQELLAGSGVGNHLTGLITGATAYDSGTYNVAGDTRIDQIRHAILQVRLLGLATFAADGIVLHPTDMQKIELTKTEEGGANKGLYIIGDPKTGPAVKYLWSLPVVESDSIAVGTFLTGPFQTGAVLVDRMQASTDISFSHASNFTSNLATILAEERIGLAKTRGTAFVSGAFV